MSREQYARVSRVSSKVSQREKPQLLQLTDVALLNEIRQRIKVALAANTELSEKDFLQRIGRRSPSWRTEILTNESKPWPDSITLLAQAAKALGVSVAHLIGDRERVRDVYLDQLWELWDELHDPEKEATVDHARTFLKLRGIASTGGRSSLVGDAKATATERRSPPSTGSHRRKPRSRAEP
jgi:transcriptional regulator with XRE-family HTH domain